MGRVERQWWEGWRGEDGKGEEVMVGRVER